MASIVLLFLPCLAWEGKARREFEIQVMIHFGAVLLHITLNCGVQAGGPGTLLGALQLCLHRVCSWHRHSWACPLPSEKEPSLGTCYDLCLVAWGIIKKKTCQHTSLIQA